MKKKKLKLNKDTLLVLETGELRGVAGGIVVAGGGSSACTAKCITLWCPPQTPACPGTGTCASQSNCPNATDNCSVGCPTEPQPLP